MDHRLLMLISSVLIRENIAFTVSDEIVEIKGKSIDTVVVDDLYIQEAVWCDYERDPLPKPIKQKLNIKQANRQSFRQSMRSVNRNK